MFYMMKEFELLMIKQEHMNQLKQILESFRSNCPSKGSIRIFRV